MQNNLQPIILETKNLLLRELNPGIHKHVVANFSDIDLRNYLGLQSDEEVEKQHMRMQQGMTTFNRSYRYFYLLEKENKKVIGWCGYHTWMTDHARAEIGYELFSDAFKRKGFMSEAIKPVVRFGFDEMKLHRVEACIGPTNVASIKLVRRLGFVEEGMMREHYLKNNVFEHSKIFSLLKKEYDNVNGGW